MEKIDQFEKYYLPKDENGNHLTSIYNQLMSEEILLKMNSDKENEAIPTESLLYQYISESSKKHYYDIRGLKIYVTSSMPEDHIQKIHQFIKSLECDEFKLYFFIEEKPKIFDGVQNYSISQEHHNLMKQNRNHQ